VAGARRSSALGSRRTLKLLAFAGVAYFVFWSPTVVVSLGQCFVGSFRPPPAVEFAAVWLANANSALYVVRRRRNGGGARPAMLKPRGREFLFAAAILSRIFARCWLNFHSLSLCCLHTINKQKNTGLSYP